jgi:NAD(P)H-hydrate epimerase
MIKIFTTGQAKEIDKYTIENEPVSPVDLVERAARAFMEEILLRYELSGEVIVFAGQGNNGADALAVARLLSESANCSVEAFLLNPPSGSISQECLIEKERLAEACRKRRQAGGQRLVFTEITGGNFNPPVIEKGDIVIDGLFGAGLNRPLAGGFAAVVNYINASGARVASIDIPSGLFGEDNRMNVANAIIRADLTLTFGFPKPAFLLPEAAAYVGKWKVLDIGLHRGIIDELPASFMMVEEEDVAGMIMPRPKFGHKGIFGHALLIAGSRGKMGAALLASEACLRSGAGLLTVHLPGCGEVVMQTAFPEAMVSLDENGECFSSMPDLEKYSVVGVGPGLGAGPETAAALESLLKGVRCPLLIDADAINIIAASSLTDLIPHGSILTPHPKEFDRLMGSESGSRYERIEKAYEFAKERSLIIALKGAYTATCTPEGVFFNSTGNSGMATAGSGDVLTGIILGLLAVGYRPEDAAVVGVYLHGMAGDLAVAGGAEEALIASDITNCLGRAFRLLKD